MHCGEMIKRSAGPSNTCLPLNYHHQHYRPPPFSPARESCSSLLHDDHKWSDAAAAANQKRDSRGDFVPPPARSASSSSCLPSTLLISLILGRKKGRVDPQQNRQPHLHDAKKMLVWRILVRKLLREMHSLARGIKLGKPKLIDFSYDESSYAKNFDMGHENWHKNDPCFKIQPAAEEIKISEPN